MTKRRSYKRKPEKAKVEVTDEAEDATTEVNEEQVVEAQEEELSDEDVTAEMLQTIVEETGFDAEEVRREFEIFSKNYPELEISKEDFLENHKELVLGENLFNVFDVNNSNSLNFYEFMQIKRAMELTEIEEKLEWIFKIFDLDGQGYIDVLELQDVIEGVFRMVGKHSDKEEVMECLAEIRYAIDDDRDWKITKQEFVTNGQKSKFIVDLLNNTN